MTHSCHMCQTSVDSRWWLLGWMTFARISVPILYAPVSQALTAGFFFNAAKLQRSGNYRTIKNKQTVHMHPQNGLAEVCLLPLSSACATPFRKYPLYITGMSVDVVF